MHHASITATLKQKYQKVVWALAVTETLHNLEEAIWLPDWSKAAGPWHSAVGAFEFRFAIVVVTLVFYAIIYQFSARSTTWSRYFMGGTLVVILFNVLVPHLLATLIMTRYAPGVVTGVLLNVPVSVYLLRRGIHERIFVVRDLAFGTVVIAAVLLPLLPISFALGRVIRMVAIP